MAPSRSKVHPRYKTKYRVRNWAAYDGALRNRGDLTLWFSPSALRCWTPVPSGQRGGQQQYSDAAIEVGLVLRLLFGLPWRQTEGLLGSLLRMAGTELEAPDHTTLSRRTAGLEVALPPRWEDGPVHVIVDATGLGVVGQGEWATARWSQRGRRGWKKLHIAVDDAGFILAADLTASSVADASNFSALLREIRAPIERITADGGYDQRCVYEAARARAARTVIPPRRGAILSGGQDLAERDDHVATIQQVGRRRWRLEVGQHEQARAENTFHRYKSTFGGRLRSRNQEAQRAEALTACHILNRMLELGMPDSYPVGP